MTKHNYVGMLLAVLFAFAICAGGLAKALQAEFNKESCADACYPSAVDECCSEHVICAVDKSRIDHP